MGAGTEKDVEIVKANGDPTQKNDEGSAEGKVIEADTDEGDEVHVQAERAEEQIKTADIKVVPVQRAKQEATELMDKTMLPVPKLVMDTGTIKRQQE